MAKKSKVNLIFLILIKYSWSDGNILFYFPDLKEKMKALSDKLKNGAAIPGNIS